VNPPPASRTDPGAPSRVETSTGDADTAARPNGDVMAAFLAAGIGSFAIGMFVLLHEAGIFSPPTLYGPAGGVSGRTAFAVVVWIAAWGVLHWRWRDRHVAGRGVRLITYALIAAGVLGTFPPLWALL
jgi:hypothetical protein